MSPPRPSNEKNFQYPFNSSDFSPRKSLGQHFLKDSDIARFQIEALDLRAEEVVEVGGGLGILTEILAEKAGHVWVYETDPVLAKYLRKKFESVENVSVLEEDALKADFPRSATVFASNIPYSISTPLAFKIARERFGRGVMLVQLEFAQKLSASPGSKLYRASSVAFQTMYGLQTLRTVSRFYFSPPPKVESAILFFVQRQDSPLCHFGFEEISRYFLFLKKIFTARNRTIKSALRPLLHPNERRGIQNLLSESMLSQRVRDLDAEKFFALYSRIATRLNY